MNTALNVDVTSRRARPIIVDACSCPSCERPFSDTVRRSTLIKLDWREDRPGFAHTAWICQTCAHS